MGRERCGAKDSGGEMSRKRVRFGMPAFAAVALVATVAAGTRGETASASAAAGSTGARTPIQHVVVIFQENVSFDHYFATYPNAANTDGQPFTAAPGTPAVDGLPPATASSIPAGLQHATNLLTTNPNLALPQRLDSNATGLSGDAGGQLTCDQDHDYSDEQQAFDGNTATAMWNYAQRFAMSDNSYGTTFGPSAPGAINLASGDTGNVDTSHMVGDPSISTSTSPNGDLTADGKGGYSLTSDAQPYWDDCSTRDAVALKGKNIGDLLNAAGLSWGWFEGGFRPTTSFAAAAAATGHAGQSTATFLPDEFSGSFTGKVVPTGASNQALCDAVHPVGIALGQTAATHQFGFKDDYIPHHEPFQFYASTANPHHLTVPTDPSGNDTLAGLATIGNDTQSYVGGVPQFDTPNHNYDTSDFDQLVAAITAGQLPASALPAVTFLKAPGYQDGHAAYSEPADEQAFVVHEINELEQTPDWSSTAVIVNYDDSDGWYDHANSGVTNGSASAADNLTNTTKSPPPIGAGHAVSQQCGTAAQAAAALAGEQGRCGFGPRLPLLVVSPCAKQNYVAHDLTDQASIINFVEYNWGLPGIPGSADQALAATDAAEGIPFDLAGMFDFSHCSAPALPLDPATGQIDFAGQSLNGKNLRGTNLSGGELAGTSLNGDNLQGAFLENLDLHGGSAQGTNLQGADLKNANLQGTNLQGTNLQGANFNGANLQGATLQGTNLGGADFTGANLSGANLTGANVSKATWSHTTCPDGTSSDSDGGTCQGHLG